MTGNIIIFPYQRQRLNLCSFPTRQIDYSISKPAQISPEYFKLVLPLVNSRWNLDNIWALTQQNLSSGFLIKQDSNQSTQLEY